MGAHGIVAVGPDVLEAEHTAELIEETAQVAYLHEMGARANLLTLAPATIGNRDIAWMTREGLVACGRKVAAKNLVVGAEGSISARCGDAIYILGRDVSLSEADPDDFVEVDLSSARSLHGKKQPCSDLIMHIACYRARPEVRAVIYSGPPMIMAATFHGLDSEAGFQHLGLIQTATSESGDIESAARSHDAMVVANRGLLAVGVSLTDALVRTELLERMAHIIVIRRSIGDSGWGGA
jgi:L-fuculose-phosphate aldolase